MDALIQHCQTRSDGIIHRHRVFPGLDLSARRFVRERDAAHPASPDSSTEHAQVSLWQQPRSLQTILNSWIPHVRIHLYSVYPHFYALCLNTSPLRA